MSNQNKTNQNFKGIAQKAAVTIITSRPGILTITVGFEIIFGVVTAIGIISLDSHHHQAFVMTSNANLHGSPDTQQGAGDNTATIKRH